MSDTGISPNDPVQQMCDLVAGMAKALADHPDGVRVESEVTDSEVVLHLVVSLDDLGRVMGKQGRTARSIRTILNAAGSKQHHRFNLDVQSDS